MLLAGSMQYNNKEFVTQKIK